MLVRNPDVCLEGLRHEGLYGEEVIPDEHSSDVDLSARIGGIGE